MKSSFKILLAGCLIFLFFSCKTVSKVTIHNKPLKKNISDKKLFQKIENNYLDYSNILIKRAVVSIESNDKKKKFSSVIKINKDSIIWMSVRAPLGIEVLRIMFTNDSVKILDKLHKSYLVEDYNYINQLFNLELNYDIIQAILTKRLFEYKKENKKPFVKKFKGYSVGPYYAFTYYKARKKIFKKIKKEKIEKLDKYKDLIHQSFTIHPKSFAVMKVNVNEILSDRQLTIVYDNFEFLDILNLPRIIKFNLTGEDMELLGTIKLNKITLNTKLNYKFSIPKKFKPFSK